MNKLSISIVFTLGFKINVKILKRKPVEPKLFFPIFFLFKGGDNVEWINNIADLKYEFIITLKLIGYISVANSLTNSFVINSDKILLSH